MPRPTTTRVLRVVDGAVFGFAGAAAVWLAFLLLQQGVRLGWPTLLLLPFWLVVTYLTLPRLHRVLSRVYVPGYFIGRTRTSDGLLGDPVNLAFRGGEAAVHAALTGAGWSRADDLTVRTGLHIVSTTLRRHSYPAAPVSPLELFERQQDFAYQQQVAGNPAKRHHVRFWRCPDGWFLPGGTAVDWVAAATYDRSVGLSLFTLQVTHKIEADTDVERDFVVASLTRADPHVRVHLIEHFSSGYHARNGGGDLIETDGDLPVVEVGPSPDPPEARAPGTTDSRDQRPAQTVFGALVAFGRSALWFLAAAGTLLAPRLLARLADLQADALPDLAHSGTTTGAVAATLAAFGLGELGLGLATLSGRNWARVWLMGSAVSTTVASFAGSLGGRTPVTLLDLPVVASAVLLLLALSSHRARDFAARRHESVDEKRPVLVTR